MLLPALLVLEALYFASGQGPTVTTNYGDVEGTYEQDGDGNPYDLFLGIPFATPPTGDLRWEKPQPPAAWDGVYQATQFGKWCQQLGLPFTSEDCLYINVYVPDSVADHINDPLPVMVWIYGGAFLLGWANMYNGTYVATRGKVVYVSFNYRVSTTGFMSTMNDAALGNYGMWDQVAALQWVHDNIAAFGGDPNRVTIIGQSAGGASVSLLTISPPARGLFQRAIPMSGSAASFFGTAYLQAVTTRLLAESYGCSNVTNGEAIVTCLRRRTAWSLNIDGLLVPVGHGYLPTQLPVVDGDFMPIDPAEAFNQGYDADYDLLTGRGRDDGSMFALPFTATPETLRAGLLFMLNVYVNNVELADMVYTQYPGMASDDKTTRQQAATQALTDFVFGCRSFLEVNEHSVNTIDTGKSTYYYLFDYQHWFRNVSWITGMHFEDVAFFFGQSFAPGIMPMDADDMTLSNYIQSYYCNFAYTGNPNEGPHAVPSIWPQYDTTSKEQMVETLSMTSQPIDTDVIDRYNWWNDVFYPAIVRYNTTDAIPTAEEGKEIMARAQKVVTEILYMQMTETDPLHEYLTRVIKNAIEEEQKLQ